MTKTNCLLCLGLALSGCAAVPDGTGSASLVEAPALSTVTVRLHRLRSFAIPVSTEGLTLRQAITTARDDSQANQIDRHLLNNLSELSELGIATEQLQQRAGDNVWVGQEVYALTKGNQTFFFPDDIVHSSCAGSIQLNHGDIVESLPLEFFMGHSDNQAFDLWRPDGHKSITVIAPVLNYQESVAGDAGELSLDSLFDYSLFDLPDDDSAPRLPGYVLRPNIVVISRASESGSSLQHIFLPAPINVESNELGRLDLKYDDFLALDGDVVRIMRLEQHPLVSASLQR